MSNLELSYDFIDPQLDWACVEPGEKEPPGRQTGGRASSASPWKDRLGKETDPGQPQTEWDGGSPF